jgi:hypothetical protein
MIVAHQIETFVPLRQTAAHLGVPASWLRAEAEAGRVPHLKTGRQVLFHPPTVEQALLDRAKTNASVGQEDAPVVEQEPRHAG